MREFGSDFNYCSGYIDKENHNIKIKASFYATGRQALQHLIINNNWKRIWMPAYFCYDIIELVKQTGITVMLYPDSPTEFDELIIPKIEFKPKDVLLRMNYFGLRQWRNNINIPADVIEDHSHDLIGEWALTSNADWCIASLRKSLPIPDGGILWSPKNYLLLTPPESVEENEINSNKRLSAMLLKTLYLSGVNVSKEYFRNLYLETEKKLDKLTLCTTSMISKSIVEQFDIDKWYKQKKRNWKTLSDINYKNVTVLKPERLIVCNPFSIILKFNTSDIREKAKSLLIENNIYPAVLWDIPGDEKNSIHNTSETLLSIHCDGRYDDNDMEELKQKVTGILASLQS